MTPLALLHPSGSARRALVVGDAHGLAAGVPPAADGEAADLVVVGAGAHDVVRILRERLAADGIAYLVDDSTSARAAGLEIATRYLHLGDRAHPRFLVPTRAATARWAVSQFSSSWRARAAVRVPLLAGALAPGSIARRPGTTLAEWLDVDVRDVVLSRTAGLVLSNGNLTAVVKADGSERAALMRLAEDARAAGAQVPSVLREEPALVLSAVPGTPASLALGRAPRRLERFLDDVSAWLLRWNTATAVDATLDAELLAREVLEPARRARVDAAYRAWLEERCRALEGSSVKLVAAHNDLTTANILVDGESPLGVVDWEVAEEGALPLKDFFYAAADAHAAAAGFRDSLAGFKASLGRREHVDALGLAGDVADLCFHACWLGHAANEAADPAGERRFGDIVDTIARERIRMQS